LTIYQLEEVLDGDLDNLIDKINAEDQAKKLAKTAESEG